MPLMADGMAELARGQAALLGGDMKGAAQALCLARAQPASRLTAHNLIEQHALEGAFAQMFGLDCRIAPGDAYKLYPGCGKRALEDCRNRYNNILNFRGEPHLPGVAKLMEVGGS